jgi:hypothetical protein
MCVVAFFIALFLSLTVQEASAQAGYSRGIWFDDSGIKPKYLEDAQSQAKKYIKLGISRVHVMISNNHKDEFGLPCTCAIKLYKGKVLKEYKTEAGARQICNREESRDEFMGVIYADKKQINRCAVEEHVFGYDKWRGKSALLGRFIDHLNKAGLRVILTIWPAPNQKYIDSLSKLENLLVNRRTRTFKHKIYAIELEDEDNWYDVCYGKDKVFDNCDAAANKLFARLQEILPRGTLIGVTAHSRGFRSGEFSSDQLLRKADFISLQAYQPICKRGRKCDIAKVQGNVAPGTFQENALETITASGVLATQSATTQTKQLILGLPAYDQNIDPSATGVESMYKAARAAICAAATGNARAKLIGDSYWSSRNMGLSRNSYAEAFLKDCPVSSIARYCRSDERIGKGTPRGGPADSEAAGIALACPRVKEPQIQKRASYGGV